MFVRNINLLNFINKIFIVMKVYLIINGENSPYTYSNGYYCSSSETSYYCGGDSSGYIWSSDSTDSPIMPRNCSARRQHILKHTVVQHHNCRVDDQLQHELYEFQCRVMVLLRVLDERNQQSDNYADGFMVRVSRSVLRKDKLELQLRECAVVVDDCVVLELDWQIRVAFGHSFVQQLLRIHVSLRKRCFVR